MVKKSRSHPSWVRGLKLPEQVYNLQTQVAPLVGAWIETQMFNALLSNTAVAPLVGAWIETQTDINPE